MLKLLKWFLMLTKRLYKKVAFIAIMAIIPLIAIALSFAAKQEAGFIKICLTQENPQDEISTEIINDFLNEDTLIQFSFEPDYKKAIEQVYDGSVDVVWLFNADTKTQIDKFINSTSDKDAVVEIIVREQTILSRITQEKLSASLYKYAAKAKFVNYMQTNIVELKNIDRAVLEEYYTNNSAISENLFEIENLDSLKQTSGNYMTAPIRGLLGVLILITSAAGSMFYMQDDKKGTFSLVKETKKPFVALCCVLIATLNVALVCLITLIISGIAVGLLKEITVILVYSLCCTAFCLFLKEIFINLKVYAAAIPVLVVVMLAVCPVFLGVASIWLFLPPTYYIFAFNNVMYLYNMISFTLILFALWLALDFIKRKFKISA